MHRIIFFILVFWSLSLEVQAFQIDYRKCESLEDVIKSETLQIEQTSYSNHEELASLYIARGESYLLAAKYNDALDDFQKANFQLEYINDEEVVFNFNFLSLLSEIVCYDALGYTEEADLGIKQLQLKVDQFKCTNCNRNTLESDNPILISNKNHLTKIYRTEFADPREPQPASWCVDTVKNTCAVLRGIAANIPSSVTRFSAMELISSLQQSAINCCYAGGLWSVCIKPLADKFEQWNRKWKVLGIPPDPSWDSDLE